MSAHPGEDIAATLFADVHYYYNPETEKPRHHRFDKGSYVYLYENASQNRARIEIANNAGKPDQDAFDGLLDKVKIEFDHKHPTLVTVIIDAFASSPTARQQTETEEWRLPTYDPRNENKYLYRLHSFDIYLWNEADAKLFVNTVRRLVPSHHLAITGEPAAPPAHADAMSPIVQQLENVAIHQGQASQNQSQYAQSHHSAGSKPGSTVPQTTLPGSPGGTPAPQVASPQTVAAFSPAPYNPAAPAAPEQIVHREKTPPPSEDGTGGNPLVAAAHDQPQQQQQHYNQYNQYAQQQHPQQFQPQPLGHVLSLSAPVASPPTPSYFPGPPQPGAGQYAPSPAPPPAVSPMSPPIPGASPTPFPAGYPTNYAQAQSVSPLGQNPYPSSPGFASPPPPPGPPQQHYPTSQGYAHPVAPIAPVGGFSQYQYGAAPQQGGEYGVHQQMYRPTEAEASVKVNKLSEGATGQGGMVGKLGGGAVRLEKGVTGFLKKFEKKYA